MRYERMSDERENMYENMTNGVVHTFALGWSRGLEGGMQRVCGCAAVVQQPLGLGNDMPAGNLNDMLAHLKRLASVKRQHVRRTQADPRAQVLREQDLQSHALSSFLTRLVLSLHLASSSMHYTLREV